MEMYIQWDGEAGDIIGVPSNIQEDESWYPYASAPQRKSKAQTLVHSFVDGVVYASWSGSDDRMDSPASSEVIRQAWIEIMQYPVAADDGKVFQFDRESKELMEGAIVALTASPGSIDWRLNDNSTVSVNAASLQSYYDQLVLNRALRGVTVDAEYIAFKSSGATLRDLQLWRESYAEN